MGVAALAMLGIMAISIEFSKGVSYRVSLQNNLDQAAMALARVCAQQDPSVLNCADTPALLARAQVFVDLNSSDTVVTSAELVDDTVALSATSSQSAPLLRFLDGTNDTVSESASSTAGWTASEGQVPLRGRTPPFALDACAWIAYNPTTGTSPGSTQKYNMINDTSDFHSPVWTKCTGVPTLPPTTQAAGLDRQMLWITWDKGDVSGTDKQNNCELALKDDGVSIAQDVGYDTNPACTGVEGKFIVKVGEYDDYEYGDGSSSGIEDLGNTGGGVSLVK